MTVAEAIKQLKKYPKDAQIYLVKDWEQECDEQGCFITLYRLRDITEQHLVVEKGMDWEDVTEVLLDCEEEPAHNNAEYRERRKQQQREREHSEEYKARQREKYRARVEAKRALLRRQVCENCWLFPCFAGIETMSSNLALTCRKWHNKNLI